MNIQVGTALTATGSEQTIACERMGQLVLLCKTAEVELRSTSGGAMFPIPANTPFALGVSHGQTIYVKAVAGSTIYWMLT